MPVTAHSYLHFQAPAGTPPAAPAAVTSITKDAGATISFLPGAAGDYPVTSWLVTPYIGGAAQSPAAVGTGSAATLAASDGSTYTQVPVAGLANGTAYTFTVCGVSAAGTGAESAQSGANTPLSGLVFGDDFGGPAGAAPDPEWWRYDRCGYVGQSEIEWYLPSQCVLDGSGSLALTAVHTSHSGTTYPSDGNTFRTQPWISGACQNNTRTFVPAVTGNTMTFESRFQVCPGIPGGMWPGLFWLVGQSYLAAWKTDPQQGGSNTTDAAEIDVAEFHPYDGVTAYQNNVWGGSGLHSFAVAAGTDLSAAMHTYAFAWKPGVSARFSRDGTQTNYTTTDIPTSGCHFFMNLYLQINTGSASSPQTCYIDYVRVFDQNLG